MWIASQWDSAWMIAGCELVKNHEQRGTTQRSEAGSRAARPGDDALGGDWSSAVDLR